MDAGRFAAVLGALWTAHDVADHVVQTDHQAATKATSWRGLIGHVGSYTTTQGAALAGLHAAGVRLRPSRALAGLALSAATHAFLDRRWPVVELLRRTGSAHFAAPAVRAYGEVRHPVGTQGAVDTVAPLPLHGPYLADQALHHLCVALAAAVVAR